MKVFELIKDKIINILGNNTKILNVTHYCTYVKGNEFLIEYFIEYQKPREEGTISIKIIHGRELTKLLEEYYEKERAICESLHTE